jgi:hypothetical protein
MSYVKAAAIVLALSSATAQAAYTTKNHYLGLVDTTYNWNNTAELAEKNTITYSFDINCRWVGKTGFSRVQQAQVVYIFKQLHNITGINFRQVRLSCGHFSDINFANQNIDTVNVAGRTQAYRLFRSDTKQPSGVAAFVNIDTFDFKYQKNPLPGTEGYEVLLHEIGHAMGLKHPHEGAMKLKQSMDTTSTTVMSYNQVYGQYNRNYTLLDRNALQFIYGKDGLGGAGYTIPKK